MEVRRGQVRQVSNGLAWVAVARSSGCGRCAEAGGCGQACVARPVIYILPATQGLAEGDEVSLSVPERASLLAALMTYGVGLLAMLAGALLAGAFVNDSDLAVAVGALAGLFVTVLWLRRARLPAMLLPAMTVIPPPRCHLEP